MASLRLRAAPTVECLACDLIEHPERVPGGRIATIGQWVVEHCIGPLGVGTVVVKPIRHVLHVAELNQDEICELGPALASVAGAVTMAAADVGEPPGQVYVCLWSHARREPGHIHFVVQPVSTALMNEYNAHGPELQVRMFNADEPMGPAAVADAAARIRALLDARPE